MNKFNSAFDTFLMSDGYKIPCVGYGTFQTPDADAEALVTFALQNGYRHIDTASGYANESGVGNGIRASGVSRSEIFVTTKHWVVDRGYKKTVEAGEKSLKTLGLDYIDLYLIHWPCVKKSSPDWAEINADTWRGFEELQRRGLVRSLGVSNFEQEHLEALNKTATSKPVVNQIEFHPGYAQLDLVDYCQKNGILVEAWSPLGCGRLINNEMLVNMAAKYHVGSAAVCIRYALQHGVLPLPKSAHSDRIIANRNVFDFVISDEDMALLDAMPKTGESGWYPEDSPADAYV